MKLTLEDWLHARTENHLPIACAAGWDMDTNSAVLAMSDGKRLSYWRISGNSAMLISDIDAGDFASILNAAKLRK